MSVSSRHISDEASSSSSASLLIADTAEVAVATAAKPDAGKVDEAVAIPQDPPPCARIRSRRSRATSECDIEAARAEALAEALASSTPQIDESDRFGGARVEGVLAAADDDAPSSYRDSS